MKAETIYTAILLKAKEIGCNINESDAHDITIALKESEEYKHLTEENKRLNDKTSQANRLGKLTIDYILLEKKYNDYTYCSILKDVYPKLSNLLIEWAKEAYSKLHSLRCSYKKGQAGYDETTRIIEKTRVILWTLWRAIVAPILFIIITLLAIWGYWEFTAWIWGWGYAIETFVMCIIQLLVIGIIGVFVERVLRIYKEEQKEELWREREKQ